MRPHPLLVLCLCALARAEHQHGDVCDTCDASDLAEGTLNDVQLLQFEHHLKGGLAVSAAAFEAAYQVQGRPFFQKAFTAVRAFAVQTWREVSAAVKAVADAIGRAVTSWADAVVTFLKSAWQAIVSGLTWFANQVVSIAKIIGDGIVNLAKKAWDLLKQLWDCFNPMRFLCALFLKQCDCDAGSGLSIDFSSGTLGAKCVNFVGFPLPHFDLETQRTQTWPIGQASNGLPKLPGAESKRAKQGSATAGARPASGLRDKSLRLPAGVEASCSAGLQMGVSVGTELSPTFDLSLNLPQGAISLSVVGTAGVYADAFLTAEGSCTFKGERRFPEKPEMKVQCCPVGCIAVLLQVVMEFEATGTLTGTISASAGADVTTGAELSLSIGAGTADAKATSPQFSTRSGLDVGGSLSAKVRVGLGPLLTIWPIPGVPISIYPQINAEVRAYGELQLLNVGTMAAVMSEYNATRLRRRQRSALVQADGSVSDIAEYREEDEDEDMPPVGPGAIRTNCIAAGINIFVTLSVTGIGLPPGFAAALDTAALVTSMTSDMIDGVANMVTLPLQMTAKCIPGASGIANALKSVVDSIASLAKDAVANLASVLPSISSFLSALSDLQNIFNGKLWCKEIAQWGDSACKSQIGCNAPDAPPPAPILSVVTTTKVGQQLPPSAGATLGGRISGNDLMARLDQDPSGKLVCGSTKHVCDYQEVTALSVLGGLDASSNVWIVAGFSNWDLHRRSMWSGQDSVMCQAGNYPVWWAKWGPYYGRIHCETGNTVREVGCCDDVAASSDVSNMKLSSWTGSYSTLNGLLDQDNSGANVCGSGFHVCSFSEVTVYGATRGLSPSGWIVGSFPNWEGHRRSVWNGQDSTFCQANRFPFVFGQWYNYYSRVHCDDAGVVRNAVCCRNLPSTSRPGVMRVTASSTTYTNINAQLDGDWTGHAPCSSIGSTWHICNYQETSVFMATTGVDLPQSWIVGGFSNWEGHRRSIFNGQDSTQCSSGNFPLMYGKFSVYYGLVHCIPASSSFPVLCCADDGYKYINQDTTTSTPTTAITTTTTRAPVACTRPSGWCTHAGSVYSAAVDCDGDGVGDPFCFDKSGSTGFRSSRAGCFDSWPNGAGTCKAVCSMVSQNPSENSRVYSSIWDNNAIGTGHARSILDSAQAWSALNVQVGEWLQMDLGSAQGVTGVVVQGRSDCDQWVTRFSVRYSLTRDSFVLVPGSYAGSGDRNTKVNAVFPSMVRARYVRILPEAWHGHMSMRAGVLTCQAGASVSATGATLGSAQITPLPAPCPATPSGTSCHLPGGLTLAVGTSYWSLNKNSFVVMQGDGNLVVYRSNGQAPWASHTAGNPGAVARMQGDGNLVIYASTGRVLWASNTAGNAGAFLAMQADGNLVIYTSAGRAIWASNTSH